MSRLPRRHIGLRLHRGNTHGMIFFQIVFNFLDQAVADHVIADLDGGCKALGVRSAMTFYDNAVQSEKHAAIDLARVHLLAHPVEGALGQQIAEPCHPGARHGRAQIIGDLAGGAFGGLQRDIAGKAFGDHHIDGALADIVTFDETEIVDRVEIGLADQAAGLLDLFLALDFLDADIEQADGRPLALRTARAPWRRPSARNRAVAGHQRRSWRRYRARCFRRAWSARCRQWPAVRYWPSSAGRISPWPSARRYCRQRRRHPPRLSLTASIAFHIDEA